MNMNQFEQVSPFGGFSAFGGQTSFNPTPMHMVQETPTYASPRSFEPIFPSPHPSVAQTPFYMASSASTASSSTPSAARTPTCSAKKMTMARGRAERKERALEACMKQVKAHRASLLAGMRAGTLTPTTLRTEMGRLYAHEWRAVDPSSSSSDGLRPEELAEAEYMESIVALEQAFLEDIRRDEEALVEQYFEEVRRYEEEQLRDAIERHEHEEDSDPVWCPICRRGQLKQSHRFIFCSHQPCGLRLDTKQDEITLNYVRQRLCEVMQQHSQRCSAAPGFSLQQEPFSSVIMLCMACSACNSLDIIL